MTAIGRRPSTVGADNVTNECLCDKAPTADDVLQVIATSEVLSAITRHKEK